MYAEPDLKATGSQDKPSSQTNHVQNVRSSPSFGRIGGSYAESVTVAWDDADKLMLKFLLSCYIFKGVVKMKMIDHKKFF